VPDAMKDRHELTSRGGFSELGRKDLNESYFTTLQHFRTKWKAEVWM